MSRQLNLGFIGCGTHSLRGHALPVLGMKDRFRVSALCDPSLEASAAFARAIGHDAVARFERVEDLLAVPWIDAVVIGSPDRFHAEQARLAVTAGKHVLVDKPCAARAEDLAQVAGTLEIAREKRLVATSCHPRRFNLPYRRLRSELGSLRDRFGEALEVALDFSYHATAKTGLHDGLMIDHVSHEFDYVNFLLGEASTELRAAFDSQDRYHAHGWRADGVALSFTGTRRLKGRIYPEWIRIRFESGHVELETKTGFMTVTDHEDGSVLRKPFGATDYEDAFRRLMDDFWGAIVRKDEPYLTATDLLRNSEVGVRLNDVGTYRT